jgi:hypothetical protein
MRDRKTTEEELEKMLEEATVDCYDGYEEFMGVLYCLAGGMSFPFKAKALGDIVEVIGIDTEESSRGRGVIARVRKRGDEYTIDLGSLELVPEDTENAKWFEMYDYWVGRF